MDFSTARNVQTLQGCSDGLGRIWVRVCQNWSVEGPVVMILLEQLCEINHT